MNYYPLQMKKQQNINLMKGLFSSSCSIYDNQKPVQVNEEKMIRGTFCGKKRIPQFRKRIQDQKQNEVGICKIQELNFSFSVMIKRQKLFKLKSLSQQNMRTKMMKLKDIVSGIQSLSEKFGYFYLTQNMIFINPQGRIKVWINQNVLKNQRQHPINHGVHSERIFLHDFKANFQNILGQDWHLFERKSLKQILNDMKKFFHYKTESVDFADKNLVQNSFSQILNKRRPVSSVNIQQNSRLTRQISFSYINNNERQLYSENLKIQKPKITFSFQNPPSQNEKQEHINSPIENSFNSFQRQSLNEDLKISFPHTTNHTFYPLTSNGSISLNNLRDTINTCKKEDESPTIKEQSHCSVIHSGILEESSSNNDIEHQLQNLFSSRDSESEIIEMEQIREEFNCILEA